jgi:hypothetical protein
MAIDPVRVGGEIGASAWVVARTKFSMARPLLKRCTPLESNLAKERVPIFQTRRSIAATRQRSVPER